MEFLGDEWYYTQLFYYSPCKMGTSSSRQFVIHQVENIKSGRLVGIVDFVSVCLFSIC